MDRAWPFENTPEAPKKAPSPESFAGERGEGTEAVVVRIGLNGTQLVLVGPDGDWQRWVYTSAEEAEGAGRALGIPVHVGQYPEEMRVRINRHRRPAEDFDRNAYPEQGAVGPVIAYPENRPRRVDRAEEEPMYPVRPSEDPAAPRA